jgi:diacylglycerol O-acyltransferase
MATKIAPGDLTWLLMDRPNNLMVVNGLMMFDRLPDLDAFSEIIFERLVEKFRVLSQVPVERDGTWYWEDDPDFDLGRHVFRVHLDDVEEATIQAHMSQQFSEPFDPKHPLWQMQVVSGPDPDGPGVIYGRYHHGIADGIRLVQLMLSACDAAEGSAPPKVGRRTEHRNPFEQAVRLVGRSVRDGVDFTKNAGAAAIKAGAAVATTNPLGLPHVLSGALEKARHPLQLMDDLTGLASVENESSNSWREIARMLFANESQTGAWSGTPGIAKSVAWLDGYPLEGLRQTTKALGGTLNDLLVGAVSLALTDYLAERGVEDVQDLSWLMPISLQPVDTTLPPTLGNHFCVVQLSMPLGIGDHRALVRELHERSSRLKNSAEPVIAFGVTQIMAELPLTVAREVTNYFAGKAIGQLSNVPGPRVELTLAGVPVRSVLGWVPTSGDQPLGICIFTYNGSLNVGVASDARMIPDPDRIIELVREHLDALVETGVPA